MSAEDELDALLGGLVLTPPFPVPTSVAAGNGNTLATRGDGKAFSVSGISTCAE